MAAKIVRLFLVLWGAGCLAFPSSPPTIPPLCAQSSPGGPNTQPIQETLEKLADVQREAQEKVADLVEKATGFIEDQVTKKERITDEDLPIEVDLKDRPLVYLLPIEGEVRPIMMTLFKRGLAEAKDEGAELVLLEMDTPGGELFIAEEISSTLLESEVPTVTWIKDQGLSAGMLIAISTQKIFMKPVIAGVGDCQPIFLTTGEIKAAPEKILTEVRRYGRRAAAKHGYDEAIVTAMIDESASYSNADCNVFCASGQLLTLTGEEAVCLGFATGLAEDVEGVLAALNLGNARIKKFEKNWAESLAAFIVSPAFSGLLTLLGLAGLFIEYKTPGFGFPGAFGLACLGLVFWGHSIAHLAGYEGAMIFAIGALLLAAEIFIFPGFGIAGAGGLALILIGLIMTFLKVPVQDPLFMPEIHLVTPITIVGFAVVGAIVLLLVAAKFLPETTLMAGIGITLPTELRTGEGYSSHDMAKISSLMGALGVALSPLKPSGIAQIGGERVNVVTEGDFIDTGQKVRVVAVEGMRVLVQPEEPNA